MTSVITPLCFAFFHHSGRLRSSRERRRGGGDITWKKKKKHSAWNHSDVSSWPVSATFGDKRAELCTDTTPDAQSSRLDVAQSAHHIMKTKADVLDAVLYFFSSQLSLSVCCKPFCSLFSTCHLVSRLADLVKDSVSELVHSFNWKN